DDPYEAPENPDLVCSTHQETVEESAAKVIRLLEERGYIPAAGSAAAPEVRVAAAGAPRAAATPGPSTPHGGQLVNRELEGDAAADARARAKDLPKIELGERELADLE